VYHETIEEGSTSVTRSDDGRRFIEAQGPVERAAFVPGESVGGGENHASS
jgi:hypothetical protein